MAANFTPELQNLKSLFDQNMEAALYQFPQMNPSDLETTSHMMNLQGLFGLFSHDNNFLPPGPEFPGNLADSFPGFFPVSSHPDNNLHKDNKRKSTETPETSSAYSSPSASQNTTKRKNSSGKGKRLKNNEIDEKQSNDVVHVRARRGQATDSHSLAERVRRGKINERLKCLQSIVPGCYKTMGMSGMLDEIINYVQSLQNQVEFLSMKLTAASSYHDFNSETDLIDALQRAKAYESMMQKVVKGEGYEEGSASQSQVGQFDLSFVSYPQLPHNR